LGVDSANLVHFNPFCTGPCSRHVRDTFETSSSLLREFAKKTRTRVEEDPKKGRTKGHKRRARRSGRREAKVILLLRLSRDSADRESKKSKTGSSPMCLRIGSAVPSCSGCGTHRQRWISSGGARKGNRKTRDCKADRPRRFPKTSEVYRQPETLGSLLPFQHLFSGEAFEPFNSFSHLLVFRLFFSFYH
jgi:hypothetical protein